MTKYIAHASIGENGKVTGGKVGDQTGKEVCVRAWYSKPWGYVLRLKDEKVRKQFGNNMIDIANNNNVGYNQTNRNTLLTQAIKVDFNFTKIATKCNTDCSAMVTTAILGAIYKVLGKSEYEKTYKVLYAGNNCRTTSTLRSGLNTLKLITVYSTSTYTGSTSKLVYGDILLKEGSHVVAYVDTGKKVTVNSTATTSSETTAPTFTVGKTYTLQTELKVRTGAGTNYSAKTHSQLSKDGQKNDVDKDGALDKGTKVTCKAVKKVGSDIWIQIPSGWVAAYYQGNIYIK